MSYEISLAAEEDWRSIVNYTIDNHGETQTRKLLFKAHQEPKSTQGIA